MAKSKKRKRPVQPRTVFYEAVPMFIAPPAPLTGGREALAESTTAITEFGRGLASRATAIHWPSLWQQTIARLRQGLQWIRPRIKATASASAAATRQGIAVTRYAAGYTLDNLARYTPPITADSWRLAQRGGKVVFGRRARLLYLAGTLSGMVAVIVIGTAVATATLNAYASDIATPAALMSKKKTGTTILDRNGQVLYAGYGAQATKPVALSELPTALRDATLAAEDPRFYEHPGFSWRDTARAAWVDVTKRSRAEGGSTLTQQLVKNALLTSDKKFERKYQEVLLAMQLERRYSKDQILEMYLNQIYYGQGASGVEAASQTYFRKPARELTLSEAALMAGLPLGPSRFDPNFDLEAATGRRDYVLARMAELGKITKAQADAAKATPIRLARTDAAPTPDEPTPMVVYAKKINIQAPHFVFYVLNQLRSQYGDDIVEQGGITVQTTLDLNKQRIAEDSIRARVGALAGNHVTNGALISIEPGSGNIMAMVGSIDYNAPGFGNVNVTLAERQPGSSFKPIAYATAFKKGWNGATQVEDAPFSAPNGNGTLWVPQNYDGEFHGRLSLRKALDNSYNIPAIKVLQFAGIDETIQTAHDMGITTLNERSRYGLSLVLGGGEVRPIDLATVYATFANGGNRVDPRSITKVTDRHDKDITKASTANPRPVLDPRVAFMITSIISDNNSRAPEFPVNSPLKLSRPAAAKTGTTNDFRDNWTAGYTPQLATVVWVGNNDNTAMAGVDGITGAAPIWHEYMERAHDGLPVVEFTPPSGITMAKVCSSGGLANPWDTGVDEAFLADAVPTNRCSSLPAFLGGREGDPDQDDKRRRHGRRDDEPTDPGNPTLPGQPTEPFPDNPIPAPTPWLF